jgi:hypothetical protein
LRVERCHYLMGSGRRGRPAPLSKLAGNSSSARSRSCPFQTHSTRRRTTVLLTPLTVLRCFRPPYERRGLVVSVAQGRHTGNEAGGRGGHEENRDHAEHDRRCPKPPRAEKVAQDTQRRSHDPADTLALAPRSAKRMPPAPNRMPTMQQILPPRSLTASSRPPPLSIPLLLTSFRLPSQLLLACVRTTRSTCAGDVRMRNEHIRRNWLERCGGSASC